MGVELLGQHSYFVSILEHFHGLRSGSENTLQVWPELQASAPIKARQDGVCSVVPVVDMGGRAGVTSEDARGLWLAIVANRLHV